MCNTTNTQACKIGDEAAAEALLTYCFHYQREPAKMPTAGVWRIFKRTVLVVAW